MRKMKNEVKVRNVTIAGKIDKWYCYVVEVCVCREKRKIDREREKNCVRTIRNECVRTSTKDLLSN